jgi:hydroxyethylthiazole kinase-like uncharacterized protein yjeF
MPAARSPFPLRALPGLRRIGSDSGPWPLYASSAARALEAAALARHAPGELMERAGLAVARLARALVPQARLVEIWCGPGNNGGDGHVAARLLHEAGTAVRLVECADAARLPPDAAAARRRAIAVGLTILSVESAQAASDKPDLVIVGLLGLGAARPAAGLLAQAIDCINRRGVPVLAVDLPTGLHPDSGQPLGAAVRADVTLALLSLKPGLYTGHGRDLAGTVWLDTLDAGPGNVRLAVNSGEPIPATALTSATALLSGPRRRQRLPHATHKGRRGDAWVVGGAPGMTGAAWLAARAALAAGAGRVYLSPLTEAAVETAFDPQRPELMVRAYAVAGATLRATATAVVGCGGGDAVRACLPQLLAECPRLVLDADALNHIAREPPLQRLLQGRATRGQATVLTPHPLEAARLLATDTATVQGDRLAAANTLAERYAAVVVLKGSGSIIAAPSALARINASGNAALATAGTGDVLAGWLGGLWAQAPGDAPMDIAAAAVWQHGHAADVVCPGGHAPLLAADLIAALAKNA